MARKSKRSRASYVRAARKAARTRRRKNPTKHRVTVYGTGRGKRKRLRRSPHARLRPRRINRRRRNPSALAMGKRYFGKSRMTNALMLLAGIGVAGVIKGFAVRTIAHPLFSRFYGAFSIIAGAMVNSRSRRKDLKSLGTGMVVFGFYDLITQNIPAVGAYLPTIGAPTFLSPAVAETTEGYMDYGRDVMGASIGSGTGAVEVVGGSNISQGVAPEIVGDGMDLADALEMAA